LHLNSDESKAIPFFKRAIEMDPNFALAYAAMGQSYSNLGEDELAAKYTKQAFDRRDRASEREKLYITTHYYDNVTHEPAQSIQTYELWAKTYPRDDLPHNNLAVIYGGMGQLERALQEAQEAVHLDPNDSNNVANLGFSYLALNRFDEARRILEQALVHVPDNFVCRVGIYILALLRGDARTMQQQVAWASGKAGVENIFLSIEANTATAHGNLAKARDLVQRSVAADKRDNLSAHAAATQAQAALWEAQYGNVELARKEVSALLTKEAGEIAKNHGRARFRRSQRRPARGGDCQRVKPAGSQ
jgi:tetratricopeptide (TPR) repeat protein